MQQEGNRYSLVEHVTHDLLAGADQREGSRGRHTQVEHCLAAYKFSQG